MCPYEHLAWDEFDGALERNGVLEAHARHAVDLDLLRGVGGGGHDDHGKVDGRRGIGRGAGKVADVAKIGPAADKQQTAKVQKKCQKCQKIVRKMAEKAVLIKKIKLFVRFSVPERHCAVVVEADEHARRELDLDDRRELAHCAQRNTRAARRGGAADGPHAHQAEVLGDGHDGGGAKEDAARGARDRRAAKLNSLDLDRLFDLRSEGGVASRHGLAERRIVNAVNAKERAGGEDDHEALLGIVPGTIVNKDQKQ